MTKLTNAKVEKWEGSIGHKADGTTIKMASIKLALEDYQFVIQKPPKGLGMGFTEYVRGKIEEDMAHHRGKPGNYKANLAREVYMREQFYNDIYDRLYHAMTDWFEEQNMNKSHLRHALIMLDDILEGQPHEPHHFPDWQKIHNDVLTQAPAWNQAKGDRLKEIAVNASDLLLVMLKFFIRVQPSVEETHRLMSTLRRTTLIEQIDRKYDMKMSEDAEKALGGKLAAREASTYYPGDDNDITLAPWEED